MVLQRGADTTPQIEVAVTQMFPTVNAPPTFTVTELVPAPEVIDTPVGVVQV